ncbi:MAG: hypothetical protein WA958_19705 [Tunicatimonas sp.]
MRYLKFPLLFVILLASSSFQAGVIREDFARWVDYAAWRVVDAYMQDYVRLRPDMTAEKEGYRLFQETYNAENYSLSNPPPSEAVRLFLVSHDWRGTALNLYDPLVETKEAYQNEWSAAQAAEVLQERIAAVSPEALGAQSDADYTTLSTTKEQLTTEITSGLGQSEATADTATGANAAEVDATALQEDNTRGFALPTASNSQGATNGGMFSYAINPISLGAAVVLLLLLLYLFKIIRGLDQRVDQHSKRIEDLTSRLLMRKDPVSAEEAKQLKSRIASLEEQLKKLTAVPPPPARRSPPPTPPAPKAKEYYLSTPNQDGTFNASSMSEQFRPSASVYKFMVTQKDGAHWAEFSVADDSEAMKDALSSPNSYLAPVCESENAYSPGAKRIVNVRPGRAVRQGDKWIVKSEQKARIRYE